MNRLRRTAATQATPGRPGRPDGGFTLVELIVAIAILGVLMGALVAAVFAALTATGQVGQRLDSTRAEQFAATSFAADVNAARSSGGVVTSGTAQCGTEPLVLELRGDSYDAAAADPTTARRLTVVAYVQRAVTVDGVAATNLHRLGCEAAVGTAAPLTPISDLVVARGLVTTAPTVTVSGAAVSLPLTPLHGSTFTLVATRRTT